VHVDDPIEQSPFQCSANLVKERIEGAFTAIKEVL